MRATFSEFSFGYAVTEELATHHRRSKRRMPPQFPTLRQEKSMGYDVKVSLPSGWLFLQFKLCEALVRKTAKEIAKNHLPLKVPFLRMNLMPAKRSRQHRLLLNLEQKGENVFYAAPRFYKDKEFCLYYQQRHILRNSAFIRPSAIGPLPDCNSHHVSFDRFADFGWFLSEPAEVRQILNGEALVERVMENVDYGASVRDRLVETLGRMRTALAEGHVRSWPRPYEDDEYREGLTEDVRLLFLRLEFLALRDFDAFLTPIYRNTIEE